MTDASRARVADGRRVESLRRAVTPCRVAILAAVADGCGDRRSIGERVGQEYVYTWRILRSLQEAGLVESVRAGRGLATYRISPLGTRLLSLLGDLPDPDRVMATRWNDAVTPGDGAGRSPSRRRALEAVRKFVSSGPGGVNAELVAAALGWHANTARYHLARLVREGYVRRVAIGKSVVYSPTDREG